MRNAVKDTGQTDLNQFLREKRSESAATHVNWNSKKADWISAVNELFRFLEHDLLQESIKDKTVKVTRGRKRIEEKYLGSYEVPELRLKIGNDHVIFSPVGRHIIGAAGRVDVKGDRDTVALIREIPSRKSEGRWKVVTERIPRVVTVPLNATSLRDTLARVML
jgi:hypothetical protein